MRKAPAVARRYVPRLTLPLEFEVIQATSPTRCGKRQHKAEEVVTDVRSREVRRLHQVVVKDVVPMQRAREVFSRDASEPE